jgi:hypothetical protein
VSGGGASEKGTKLVRRRPRQVAPPPRSGYSTPTTSNDDAPGLNGAHVNSSNSGSDGDRWPGGIPPGSTVSVTDAPRWTPSVSGRELPRAAPPGGAARPPVPLPLALASVRPDAPAAADVDAGGEGKDAGGTAAQYAGMNAAMFAPSSAAVDQGALMNRAMFGSSLDSSIDASSKLQRTVDQLRGEKCALWKHEVRELRRAATERLEATRSRGVFDTDGPFRRDLSARLWRAGQETKTVARQVIDENDAYGEDWMLPDGNIRIDQASMQRLDGLDDVRLMMLSLLLELELRPTAPYVKLRKKHKALARKISNARNELERIASGYTIPGGLALPRRRLPTHGAC